MKVSEAFRLGKTQAELDFVDVDLARDAPLFVDPFAISQRLDALSQECHLTLHAFFQRVVDAIRAGQTANAHSLFLQLREPNETRLGYSRRRPQGAGIGTMQAGQLLAALQGSTAVQTGFLRSLEECELMVEGVARDKISDLTTNVIRGHLAQYTRDQCALFNIPVRPVALPPCFNRETGDWEARYLDLPVWRGAPILLVPKVLVRYDPAYEAGDYYTKYVLEFLQAEALTAASALVQTLRNGRRVVRKKDLKRDFPYSKGFLYEFSRAHPEVLARYREDLSHVERRDRRAEVDPVDETTIAGALAAALPTIAPGNDHATEYHNFMIGAVEFLYFPRLVYPRKELEIHEGRKRIDIVMENSARSGPFADLAMIRHYPAAHVSFECKNYSREVGNPEIDQLSGRFSRERGKVGFLCCRQFEDRDRFIMRCRDTFRDDRGLILPLEDETILRWLDLVRQNRRSSLDREVSDLIAEVWLN
ncbi:MAG: hypothetical protein NTV05_03665 [Acidobacteria bacterium]|nr:hypothetical protein [Acidobacteriota bacterium]